MKRILKIGTRDSALALWQANTVLNGLRNQGIDAELVPVKSTGDIVLDKPLYELGITGIFTKTLDVALLAGEIDMAVHSMKDVPTLLPTGISEVAVLTRANSQDILVHKGLEFLEGNGVVATGSLRRRAQWLARYPDHRIENLRGNVNTRLQKLADEDWNGAIFAAAGLERLNLLPEHYIALPWMLPAPAQGAMLVVARSEDAEAQEAVKPLNNPDSAYCVAVERAFLRELEGGCTAPIGALAEIKNGSVYFKGGLFTLDGSRSCILEKTYGGNDFAGFGKACALEVLQGLGSEIMAEIRKGLAT
jgi:hydroxymethylbilane synthase